MITHKYKEGERVVVAPIEPGWIFASKNGGDIFFTHTMLLLRGRVVTITEVLSSKTTIRYKIKEDYGAHFWVDEFFVNSIANPIEIDVSAFI